MDSSFIPKELVGKDIYKILGLSINDANKENIKNIIRKSYLKCALILHPDKKEINFKEEEKDIAYAENFNTLKCAYEFLINEKLRRKYNLYVQKKSKKSTPVNNNTSLNRYLDKKKFVAYQNEKLIYKKKLEEREKARETSIRAAATSAFNNEKRNEEKEQNLQNEANLKKIKRQNENFIKRNNCSQNLQKNIKKCATDNDDRLIEIYLDNYVNNINLLKLYIKKKKILHFFVNFNFQKYYLNLNDEEKKNERKVGYILFSHRFETIQAYLFYKKYKDKINDNFKLKLLVPCNDCKDLNDPKVRESENIDKMMNEMMDDLDKIFSL
ncbi:DnaJ protein, putative [Plasmodium malariae]|uniref:DnaJ protein, putative n=1 Tax=Plasmodium malariae TaxID=5858 RepID=A0A1D3TD71_PLAMA|nr:DnaJ protein, putative [Plasmodium malariae]SCP02720.1 DnaJ protein, putative [Plasmodium malariae]